MKKILSIFVVVFLFGCTNSTTNSTTKTDNSQYWYIDRDNCRYEIVTIESCQYIHQSSYGVNHILTHKGNCNNPIHKKGN